MLRIDMYDTCPICYLCLFLIVLLWRDQTLLAFFFNDDGKPRLLHVAVDHVPHLLNDFCWTTKRAQMAAVLLTSYTNSFDRNFSLGHLMA